MKPVSLLTVVIIVGGCGSGCTPLQPNRPQVAVPSPQATGTQPQSLISAQAKAQAAELDQMPAVVVSRTAKPEIDRSGRKQVGRASFYARHFDGHKMANGHRFDPNADVAASKTLPLGTTAKVTDLSTGKSAIVTIQDRGPHVDGRVIDVSPSVAKKLDMKDDGLAKVVVKPIIEPAPDGGLKVGAGAAEASTLVLQDAVRSTLELASSPDGGAVSYNDLLP